MSLKKSTDQFLYKNRINAFSALYLLFYCVLSEQFKKNASKELGIDSRNISKQLDLMNHKSPSDLSLLRDSLTKKHGYFIEPHLLWENLSGEYSSINETIDRLLTTNHKVFQGFADFAIPKYLSEKSLSLYASISDTLKNEGVDKIADFYNETLATFSTKQARLHEAALGSYSFANNKNLFDLYSSITDSLTRGRKQLTVLDPCSNDGTLLVALQKAMPEKLNTRLNFLAPLSIQAAVSTMTAITNGLRLNEFSVTAKDALHHGTGSSDKFDLSISLPSQTRQISGWSPGELRFDSLFSQFDRLPSSSTDMAYLLRGLDSLNETGIQVFCVHTGISFRGGSEQKIRKSLIERNLIEAVVDLPLGFMKQTGSPFSIYILNKSKKNDHVMLVSCKNLPNVKNAQNKPTLSHSDIDSIVDSINGTEQAGISRKVSLHEIQSNEYNLNTHRYIDYDAEPSNQLEMGL